jgi:hypothetical protein
MLTLGGELGENDTTEYAIKQVGDRYYPVIIDREAGGHYEIKNPMTGGTLSYNNPEAAEKYLQRAREKGMEGRFANRPTSPRRRRRSGTPSCPWSYPGCLSCVLPPCSGCSTTCGTGRSHRG